MNTVQQSKRPNLTQSIRSTLLPIGALLLALLSVAQNAEAKDLQGRLGLGYNAEFANMSHTGGVPGISLKYGFTKDIGLEAIFGIATTSPVNSVSAIKFTKNIFYETNLNFYFMAGGGIVTADSRSGADFLGGFGVEFFIPGIESLGLSMETGATFDNLDDGTFILKTLGVNFLNAGMHFYF